MGAPPSPPLPLSIWHLTFRQVSPNTARHFSY